MKSLIFLLFSALSCFGQQYDKQVLWTQLNWDGVSGYDGGNIFIGAASNGGNGIVLWDATNSTFKSISLGGTLAYSSGTGYLNAVIASTDLTDGTAAGRALLTGSTASAQRGSLGLGTAATTASSAYATSSQGSLAATAVQPAALATVATTGSYNDLANKPTIPGARTFTNPSRSLNSAFQPSSTKDVLASYTVDVACTISLVTGQAGTVTLEYADDSGISSNVVTVQTAVNGNTGSLTIGLNLTQTATCTLSGMIPAGKYVRIRTANTTGTPTFTARAMQEVSF